MADVTVPRGGVVSGTVTEAATGDPVANVSVQLCRSYDYSDFENSCGYSTSVSTSQNGSYEFGRLTPGSYKVAVGSSYYSSGPWLEAWFGGEDVVTATALNLTYGSLVPDVDLALVKGGSISGTLKAGDPAMAVANGYVAVYRPSGSSYVNVRSQSVYNGAFSITGLAPGTYVLQGSGQAWMPTWFGGNSFQTAQRITVVGGGDASGNDIVLQRGASISGVVTNADNGQAVSGAYVYLCPGPELLTTMRRTATTCPPPRHPPTGPTGSRRSRRVSTGCGRQPTSPPIGSPGGTAEGPGRS